MSTSETACNAVPEPRVVPSHFFLQTPLSVLHELFSRCGLTCEYNVISRPSGHCLDFVIQASVADLKATGKGCTKRAAKQSAIVHLLKALFRCPGTSSDSSSGTSTTNLTTGEDFPNSAVDALQKFCEANQWLPPSYHVGNKSRTDQGYFVITCVVKNTAVTGTGISKKLAKKHAAFKMLFYQLSCVHSKSCRGSAPNSVRKSKRAENSPNSGIKLKTERSESEKKRMKKLSRHDVSEIPTCSKSDGVIGQCKAKLSEKSGFILDDDNESLEPKSSVKVLIVKKNSSNSNSSTNIKSKQIVHKEKLAPEDARQWLSTLLLKNMNLSNSQLRRTNSDSSDVNKSNDSLRQSTSRNTAGADTEISKRKFPNSEQIYQLDTSASVDALEELRDPASEPIPISDPLPANSITMTRSLPEFSSEFMDDTTLALPQSLSAEQCSNTNTNTNTNNNDNVNRNANEVQKSESAHVNPIQDDYHYNSAERSTGGTTRESSRLPRCRVSTYLPRFTWVESDMVVMERYAWGTSVYMLPRFLAVVVVIVEFLLGLLYLCTDHVSSSEIFYTLILLIFLMFLLRAS